MSETNRGPHRARQMLELMGRTHPNVWAEHSAWRDRIKQEGDWPDWCYAPMVASGAFIQTDAGEAEQAFLTMKVSALATWRMSQGIYRIDPTLMQALTETPLDGAVPIEILQRLPEWGIYIELPEGIRTPRGWAHGVWVWLEPDKFGGGIAVYMLFDTERVIENSLRDEEMFPFMLRLSGDSLAASLSQSFPEGEGAVHALFRRCAEPVLNVLLYLCSQNSDVTRGGLPERPSHPVPKNTRRHGIKLFAPDKLVQWEVGYRLGAALRRAYEDSERPQESGETKGVVGHVRRAHWHTILSGPRKNKPAELRNRELRWMPPIAVNLPDFNKLLATVHKIREK